MERLAEQVQTTQKVLRSSESDWSMCSSSIANLAEAIESLETVEDYSNAVQLLLGLSKEIEPQLTSIRSKLVKDVCDHLLRIVTVTGRDFGKMANALLPQIVGMSRNASAAIRQPGAKLLSKLSELVRYDLTLLKRIYMQSIQDRPRVLILEQLQIIFVYWSDDEVLSWEEDVLDMVQQGLIDQHDNVRETARDVLSGFSSRWNDRLDALVEMLSRQTKLVLVHEHRGTPLAQAITDKHPELVAKADIIFRKRAHLRPGAIKPSQNKRDQKAQSQASESISPNQRGQQDFAEQSTVSSEVVASRTAAALERTASVQRSSDTLGSYGEAAEIQPTDYPDVHAFCTTQKTLQPYTVEIDETHGSQTDDDCRVSAAQSSSELSAGKGSLPLAGTEQFVNPDTVSPVDRSPLPSCRLDPESPTRSDDFSDRSSSLDPLPESTTVESRGYAGPSTPVGSDIIEVCKVELESFSASDDFFSKPIPSSSAAPTLSPSSSDNVTYRPGRRVLARQEDDILPRQAVASVMLSPDTPAVDVAAFNHRSVETTSPSIIGSSRLYQEAAFFEDEQYVEDVLDGADESDCVDSDGELDHYRPGCIRSPSGVGSELVEENDEAKPNLINKQDERHRDEGPGYLLDTVSEYRRLDHSQSRSGGDSSAVDVHDEQLSSSEHDVIFDEARVRNDTEEEECEREDLSVEMKSESMDDDALTGLLEVHKEMTRLRENTKHGEGCDSSVPVDKRSKLAQHTIDAVEMEREAREQCSVSRRSQPWEEPRSNVSDRADHVTQNLLLVSTVDTVAAQPRSSSHSEQVAEHSISRTEDYAQERSEKSNGFELQVKHSSSRACAPASARYYEHGSVGFAKEITVTEPMNMPSPNVPEAVQPQGVHSTQEQDTERFHAAEMLFAEEVQSIKSPNNKPRSLRYERNTHSLPKQEVFPPTELGARLDPSYTGNRGSVQAEAMSEIDMASEAAPVNDAAALLDEGRSVTAEEDDRVFPTELGLAAGNTIEMAAPVCNKRSTSPLAPAGFPCSTLKPSIATPKMKAPPATSGWASAFTTAIAVFLAVMFCVAGIYRAVTIVHDSREYHLALKTRIDRFEAGMIESHEKVRKLEEDYAVWIDYVRKLTEEDEQHALAKFEAIQAEVQKWQQEMNADLVAFRQALSVDSIEASFAPFHVTKAEQVEEE
uniref:CLASP N-terminal domain-containing protein n=1 Tax=Peronospora matthiolae TaxID=2874970 RepID=A0AAV1T302_9STRA